MSSEADKKMENSEAEHKSAPYQEYKALRRAAMKDFKKQAAVHFQRTADKLYNEEILPVANEKNNQELKKAEAVMHTIRNTLCLLEEMDDYFEGPPAELKVVTSAAGVVNEYKGKKMTEHETYLGTQKELEKNLKALEEL